MADTVNIRKESTGEEKDVPVGAVPFFANQGFKVVKETDPRPAKSASKSDWVAFAIEQGLPQEQAESMTRDDLVAHYNRDKEI